MLARADSRSSNGPIAHADTTRPISPIPPDKLPFQSLTVVDDASSEVHLWTGQKFKDVRSLQKLRIDDPQLSRKEVIPLVNQCHCLRELTIPYSLLSDDLLTAVSMDDHVPLDLMTIEAYSDSMPLAHISDDAWLTLGSHSPDLNLALSSYLAEDEDYDALLTTTIPITHLYLGGYPTATVIRRIGENCPRLVELVVSSYSPGTIDQGLISTAKGCPNLSAVGLGDCEITCSGLVEFVGICKERLEILYIRDVSLVEDTNFDINQAASEVSSLLGRTWTPEYIPPW